MTSPEDLIEYIRYEIPKVSNYQEANALYIQLLCKLSTPERIYIHLFNQLISKVKALSSFERFLK